MCGFCKVCENTLCVSSVSVILLINLPCKKCPLRFNWIIWSAFEQIQLLLFLFQLFTSIHWNVFIAFLDDFYFSLICFLYSPDRHSLTDNKLYCEGCFHNIFIISLLLFALFLFLSLNFKLIFCPFFDRYCFLNSPKQIARWHMKFVFFFCSFFNYTLKSMLINIQKVVDIFIYAFAIDITKTEYNAIDNNSHSHRLNICDR